ncbi:MAG: beta-glucosidase BglX [Pigmentiphaga sp.]|nr:beta-glucosidase BglX [Pigmentiphaga sp.]
MRFFCRTGGPLTNWLNAACVSSLLLLSPVAAAPNPALLNQKEAFINDLIRQMTLEEKIGQLRLISIGPEMPKEQIVEEIAAGRIGGTFNSTRRDENRPMQEAATHRSRLGIPMLFAYDVIHGHRTIFPIPLGLAASWDLETIEESARLSAKEATADSLDLTFAPMVDISRDARWGRSSEGYGEDPQLVSDIARALVRGYQGDSPAQPDRMMASVKHFALYGAVEGGRDYNIVDMSPMRMHQDFLPPYKAAIEAGAGGVMVALNTVNGYPASANPWLLQDLLRQQWGFKGLTISDHGAIDELLRHGVASTKREAAKLALTAGVDMSMADTLYLSELPDLIRSGELDEALLDRSVRNVLGAKYDMGLFHQPFLRIGQAADDPDDVRAESRLHRAEARRISAQSLVLLENKNQTLPLDPRATIALIGPLADSPIDMLGSWAAAGNAKQVVTLRQGMETALAGHGALLYARGSDITQDQGVVDYLNFLNWDEKEVTQDGRDPDTMIREALDIAAQADVIVAAVGESRGMSHESSSRTTLDLPESQQRLLVALKETGKPLVIVLMNGRPLALNWEKANADALLETWFAGTEGGNAIADVLFGKVNPSGKLPVSFPRSVGQIPTYYNRLRVGRPYQEGKPGNYTSQYFEEPTGALYPFGYGLSYTEFALSELVLSRAAMQPGQTVIASVNVENQGQRPGETTVQLYIRDVAASVVRAEKELKHYQKVMLAPGERKTLHFTVSEADLKFFNAQLEQVAEPGEFEVQVGLDSKDVQTARFLLQGE